MSDKYATYNVKIMYRDHSEYNRIIHRGMTLEEAQACCSHPNASSQTCTRSYHRQYHTEARGPWFLGYDKE